MRQYLNKGISTPIAIAIVLILVIIVGSFTWWQYGKTWRETSELSEIEIPEKEETILDLETSIFVKEKEVPDEIKDFLVDNVKDENPEFVMFCDNEEDFGIEDYEFKSEAIDLNNDGVEEFIVSPEKICGVSVFQGATGLGPFFIFQKIDNKWTKIGDIYGNIYVIKEEKVHGYYNIVTYERLSIISGILTRYSWQKDKLKYEKDVSSEVKASDVFPDETADWKIYRNEELGFEIKYLSDYEILDSTPNVFRISKKNSSENIRFSSLVSVYGDLGCCWDCRFEEKEIIVEDIKLSPITYSNLEGLSTGPKEEKECETLPLVTHTVWSEFCLDKYSNYLGSYCEQGKERFFYQFILVCSGENWKGIKGKNKCVQLFNQILSTFRFINPVADYLKDAELQYEGGTQKENIITALNDILILSEEQLKEKRYKDYTGKENQWDLSTLIYRHFVPKAPGVTLGNNFFQDVKSEEAQEQVKQILERYLK